MTAENYHLKWDSHSTYLNSSVATLYKNEKYADVVLYSCNTTVSSNSSMPTTVGISAHRFILSSCSQFFSSIFETSPIANNGQFHIILPPDLSHRAIQILVQYMYMGEATVSNDILSEVLKGGEILKIRGLCRTPSSPPVTTNMPQQNRTETLQTSNNVAAATYNLIRMPLSTGATSVRYLVEQQTQPVSRGLCASLALPKNSPVIMKSTKPLSTLTVPSVVSMGKLTSSSSSSAITINKHVAIDPGEKCCYSQETSTTVLREETTSSSSMCNEVGCNGCTPRMTENPPQIINLQRESQSHSDSANNSGTTCTKPCPEYNMQQQQQQQTAASDCIEDNNPTNLYEQEIQHLSNLAATSSSNDHSDSMHDYGVQDTGFNYPNNMIGQHLGSISTSSPTPTSSTQVAMHETSMPYVSIKEEPADWMASSNSSHHQGGNNLHSLPKKLGGNNDFKVQKIKTEPTPSNSSSLDAAAVAAAEACQLLSTNQAMGGNDFESSYLACDICKKLCEDKASLIRHLDTHNATPCSSGFNATSSGGGGGETSSSTAATKSAYVPKKRRRISQQENTSDHVCLQCDICSTRFETPQEWVRHMSSQHTEVELAIFNNKKDAEKNNPPPSTSNLKKLGCNLQQHHAQRVQALSNSGSTNSNLANSTSVLCTSPPTNGSNGIADAASTTGYLRSTLSPA